MLSISILKRLRAFSSSIYPKVTTLSSLSILLISSTLAMCVSLSSIAYADTLGYPWPTDTQAPCEFGSAGGARCVNPNNQYDLYDWGVYVNGVFHPYRSGYEYRNCTDYTQWKESTEGVSVPSNWGNGGQWYGNAPSNEQSSTPKAWDAAVVPGNPGHVAFVESVNSDGTITVSEYNHDTHGDGDARTGTASSMGFTEFVDFGVHPTSPPPPPPPPAPPVEANYITMRSGNTTQAKAGLNDTWTPEYPNASDMQAAGTRMAFKDATSGHIWAKDTLQGTWYDEGTADQYVVTPSYLIERSGNSVSGKAGLNDSWTPLYSSASDVQANETRILVKNTSGEIYVKDTLNGTWYDEGTADQYVVTPSYLIERSGNTTQAKAGLNDTWTPEYPNASDMQAAGTRMAFKDATSGHIWAKDTLQGTWYDEGTADQYAVNDDYVLIRNGIVLSGKVGLNDTWTTLYSWATDFEVAGQRIAIIDTLGDLMAKDTLNGPWYVESWPTVNQYAVTTTF